MFNLFMYLSGYLAIGAIVTALFDNTLSNIDDVDNFTPMEKISVMLFWPVSVIAFVVGLIKGDDTGRD